MKIKTLVIAVATVCLALSSCEKVDSDSDTGKFVIYADREEMRPTKTEIKDGTFVVWKQGDAVSLFVDEGERGGYKFVSKNLESSSSAEFEGDFKADGESHMYWAVYPYDEANSCDGNSVTTVLPSTQVAKTGSFGDDLFVSVARSSTSRMEFFNVCGGIKFTVGCDDVREVVISNVDGGLMSGTMRIIMNMGIPEVESISDGSPDLRVIAPFGETFIKGASYYAVIPPITFSQGVIIKYVLTEGYEGGACLMPPSTIYRSTFSRLPYICSSVSGGRIRPFLTFVSAGESSVCLKTEANLEYSYDAIKWEKASYGTSVRLTKRCPQFFLRGFGNSRICSDEDSSAICASGDNIACYGYVSDLLDYQHSDPDVEERSFYRLFKDCKQLTRAPRLPSSGLARYCYEEMFSGCTSLVSAPGLPATTLKESCYESMFSGCTSLVTAPRLPAVVMAESCYESMFSGCTSLVTAPRLPAVVMAESCYESMFSGCTSLVAAPELPVRDLVSRCYYNMFSGCSNLKSVKAMFLDYKCNQLDGWLSGVSPTGTFYKNRYATWWDGGGAIPEGWEVVKVEQ